MAISRPFLLALLGVALLGATVFAVQNARKGADDESATVAQQPAEQAAPAPPTPTGTEQVLRAAFAPSELNSASFEGTLSFRSGGERNTIKASGAFESTGPRDMPKADVRVSVDVPGFDGS